MATSETRIELPALDVRTLDITLIGETPLICHRWSEKAKKQILDKQMKKANPAKEAKSPEDDFEASLYPIGDDRWGFPVIAFKCAAVTACTSVSGITKVAARQAFRVGNTFDSGELVEINGTPEPREDMVRIGMGTADIRFRGQFPQWWTTVRVRYNANVLSAEQIANLFNTAGFGVGIGEWRMEKDGQAGCFRVATTEEIAMLEPAKARPRVIMSRNMKGAAKVAA